MKKILSVVLGLLITCSLFAQEHKQFNLFGVKFGDSRDDTRILLEQKGYCLNNDYRKQSDNYDNFECFSFSNGTFGKMEIQNVVIDYDFSGDYPVVKEFNIYVSNQTEYRTIDLFNAFLSKYELKSNGYAEIIYQNDIKQAFLYDGDYFTDITIVGNPVIPPKTVRKVPQDILDDF